MTTDCVLVEVRDTIATITLNAPARANGIDVAMAAALSRTVRGLEQDASVRAVLLLGAGRMFSGGGDIQTMVAVGDAIPKLVDDTLEHANDAVLRLAQFPAPVVCAVQGAAAGGGLGVALASDMIIAEEGARFRAAHTALGFSGDCGISWFLERAVGSRRARHMVLTNRALTAAEALDWGLIDRIVPADRLLDEARTAARQFAEGPTQGFAAAKRLQLASSSSSLATQLGWERAHMARTSQSADTREAVRAFVEKRKPDYRGQ